VVIVRTCGKSARPIYSFSQASFHGGPPENRTEGQPTADALVLAAFSRRLSGLD